MSFRPEHIPLDVLPLVLAHLPARRDLYHAALVDRAFHRAAVPLLYRALDAHVRLTKTGTRVHPSATLLRHPAYALHVRHIDVNGTSTTVGPDVLAQCCEALRLCTNLESLAWTGGGFVSTIDSDLVRYIAIILDARLPLRRLVVRTSPGFSPAGWAHLQRLTSLRSLAISCLVAEHAPLATWCAGLAHSLTSLDFVVGSLPDALTTQYISALPRLQALRLRQTTRTSPAVVHALLAVLPHLRELDVEHYGWNTTPPAPAPAPAPPRATLRVLSVTTTGGGPAELWPWLLQLAPRPSLETLTVHAFAATAMPRAFLARLAALHGPTLRTLRIDHVVLDRDVLAHACTRLPVLEHLACSLPWCDDPEDLGFAITRAHSLRALKVTNPRLRLDVRRVRDWMLRASSRLRLIEAGRRRFAGEWVYTRAESGSGGEACFEIQCDDKTYDTWI